MYVTVTLMFSPFGTGKAGVEPSNPSHVIIFTPVTTFCEIVLVVYGGSNVRSTSTLPPLSTSMENSIVPSQSVVPVTVDIIEPVVLAGGNNTVSGSLRNIGYCGSKIRWFATDILSSVKSPVVPTPDWLQ